MSIFENVTWSVLLYFYHEEHEAIEDKEKNSSCSSWLSIIKLS